VACVLLLLLLLLLCWSGNDGSRHWHAACKGLAVLHRCLAGRRIILLC
jgi:hypothetical protein